MQTDLNAEQYSAVTAAKGPVLIVAGPGTGKTKTLTARIAHVITTGQTEPQRILALTFTKKAAEEMRQRVTSLLPKGKSAPHILTFHALCHELLGGEQAFVSEPARLQIIKKLTRPAELKGLTVREVGLLISRAKNTGGTDMPHAKLVQAYNAALAEQGVIDFDDLLLNVRNMLRDDPVRRVAAQAQYDYLLVDEFQDTNLLQYELLQLLRGGHDNLFVIGDPKQSIYGFRGASGGIFDQFKADFPNYTPISLTVNYRSAPEIVALSNAIFDDAPDLLAHSREPGKVRAVEVLNEYSEANFVINEIQRAIGGGDLQQAVSDDERAAQHTLQDFAVLYRSRHAALAFQKAIAASGLPYQIVGEGSPYDQPQVQAIIALLTAAVNGETPALEGFSNAERSMLQDVLAQISQAVPSVLAEKLAGILGFEMTTQLQQFVNSLVRFSDLAMAVKHFKAIAEQHYYDPHAEAVTLLTIHASKGLEFPHVFLIGAEEGILPHSAPGKSEDISEERRLFYVAITRAKQQLDISHATSRGGQKAELSSFAAHVPAQLLPRIADPNLAADQKRAKKRAIKRSQQSLF